MIVEDLGKGIVTGVLFLVPAQQPLPSLPYLFSSAGRRRKRYLEAFSCLSSILVIHFS